jgi:predicted molibdopterin-dependent oxidoreductase YjgC
MGVLPDTLPGGVAAPKRGLSTGEMLKAAVNGQISALFVQGTNLVVEYPEGETARKALEQVEFLVVTDMFLTETASLANVVLPTVSVAERNCTLTNVEGRVQRTVRAMDPRGAAKADWAILNLLSEDLGQPLGYSSEADVVKTMRRTLDAAVGSAAASAAPTAAPAPVALTAERPLRLFGGKLMFDRSTLQRESVVLPGLAPDPFVELHPAEAARLSLVDGTNAVVETAHGRVELTVRVSEDTPEGAAFVPSGYVDPPVAGLWPAEAAVVACRVVRAEA